MIRTILLSMTLAAAAAAAAVAQPMHKWVDERGVTHYSEHPPPDGKATKVEVKPSGPASAAESPDRWKQRELDSRQRRLEKEQKEQLDQAREQKAAAQRKSRCRRAKHELEILETQAPVYRRNERDEKVYLADKDRPRHIETWRQRVAESCDR